MPPPRGRGVLSETEKMNPVGNDLTTAAIDLIARDMRREAAMCLSGALRLDPGNLVAHNLLEQHRLDGNFSDAFAIDAQIAPEDDIFRFFVNHPSSTNPIRDYLADGWRTLAELLCLLDAIDRPLIRCSSFLEFACGFGRFSRHLVRVLSPQRLHVSDIVPGSVDFLKTNLGVEGFYSTSTPEALVVPRSYEMIFVLSLFSHLPCATWTRWLVRLFEVLEPGGVLIISTHGEKCARMAALELPEDGFLFFGSSESQALDGNDYGSTFTSAAFVRRVVAENLAGSILHEFPAHFWSNQDGFAIVKAHAPAVAVANATENALVVSANKIAQDERFRETVWRHCAYRSHDETIARLKTGIHYNDQMLRHSLKHFHAENPSLSQYFNVALQQHNAVQQILRALFDHPKQIDVLDFACGYGRLLRFLRLSIPPERIWAAEIQSDAVDFVSREYGVHGLQSKSEPARFDPGRHFDFIWVASLFSHLSERLFRSWLARLHCLLNPGGILCFSVHDECLLPREISLPESGFYFVPQSENADLNTAIYGTTFVSEAFVANEVNEVLGGEFPCHRIRRGLANEQDIYVVPADKHTDLSSLSGFRRGPWGWVDELKVGKAGEIYVRGWAASLDDGAIDGVTITIDGRPSRGTMGHSREDVARVLGDTRLAASGWDFRGSLRAAAIEAYVEVSAETLRGERALLYAGPLSPLPSRD